jgi:glycosyltransferase involved in cell wall biosynthesis
LERLRRDPELRRRLAEAGRERILGFRWEALAERLEGLFRAAGPN